MPQVSGEPLIRAIIASAMPVLPDVGSSSARPGSSSPEASAASIIAFATRSLIEPGGFWPSSFAKSCTEGVGERRVSSTSGVDPIRSRSDAACVLSRTSPGSGTADQGGGRPAGDGRKENHGRAFVDFGVEAVERAHVLAAEKDVDEGGEPAVLQQL